MSTGAFDDCWALRAGPSRPELTRRLRETYGKYAAKSSLTQALLDERAADRRREDDKAARIRAS